MKRYFFILCCLILSILFQLLNPINSNNIYKAPCHSLIIPAYFYPNIRNTPNNWETVTALGKTTVGFMIVSPNSGPGSSSNSDYVTAVKNAQQAGIKVIGYVDTNYTAISISAAETEIDAYNNWYNVDGIFFDQVSSSFSGTSYYRTLATYVRNSGTDKKVVLNNGTVPDISYFSIGDIIVTFEGSYSTYQTTTFPEWLPLYTDRSVNLVYKTANKAQMQKVLDTALAKYVYVTDDGADGNPWDILPTYWISLTSAIRTGCITPTPIVTTNSFSSSVTSELTRLHLKSARQNRSMGTSCLV
jgi:hypothetical protein